MSLSSGICGSWIELAFVNSVGLRIRERGKIDALFGDASWVNITGDVSGDVLFEVVLFPVAAILVQR